MKSIFTILITLICFSLASSQDPATTAYELRIQGKADQALTLLEESIQKDSSNALIWYELARTQLHLRPGDMDRAKRIKLIRKYIEKAYKLNPQIPAIAEFAVVVYKISLDPPSKKGL